MLIPIDGDELVEVPVELRVLEAGKGKSIVADRTYLNQQNMPGLHYLDANHAWIDSQVGEKAVSRRDARKQYSLEAFHLGDCQGTPPGFDKVTRVSVEKANYRSAAPYLS
jgi:hypothetical protein